MTLKARIEEDLKGAMRAGDALKRDTLRMVLAALKNKRIELGEDLDEAQELAVLSHGMKSRRESADQYDKAGREDLAGKERSEMSVIEAYLPSMLSEEETRAAVQSIVDELGLTSKNELGKLMKTVMARHRGQVDGKLVQSLAGELLG